MLSAETVSDMIAFLNFVQEREGEASCMSDDNADGSNQKRRRETVWGFGVCSQATMAMVPLTAGSVASSNLISMI
jgi:hypothetical protein